MRAQRLSETQHSQAVESYVGVLLEFSCADALLLCGLWGFAGMYLLLPVLSPVLGWW